MAQLANRVKETTTTTGTGTVTLAGAVTGYQTFTAAFPTGTVVWYCIAGQTGSEWEVGRGTLASTTTLTRDTVEESSNANALVNFSAGTKDVFVTISAKTRMNRGKIGAPVVPGAV